MLRNDTVLSKHKVLIFTEFKDTARYLYQQLDDAGIEGLAIIDGGYTGNRLNLIRRFSPYYNGSSSSELAENGETEIRVLISTDVLSEGLNLQDATRLINYDLHWNPVRLMQRIGRVDRRMNAEIEKQIVADHPDQKNCAARRHIGTSYRRVSLMSFFNCTIALATKHFGFPRRLGSRARNFCMKTMTSRI